VLAGLVNLVAGAVFVFAAHVAWLPALLIAVGASLGGSSAPAIAAACRPRGCAL
jgi:hypothetical protein